MDIDLQYKDIKIIVVALIRPFIWDTKYNLHI